jgi:hypothetical protein
MPQRILVCSPLEMDHFENKDADGRIERLVTRMSGG